MRREDLVKGIIIGVCCLAVIGFVGKRLEYFAKDFNDGSRPITEESKVYEIEEDVEGIIIKSEDKGDMNIKYNIYGKSESEKIKIETQIEVSASSRAAREELDIVILDIVEEGYENYEVVIGINEEVLYGEIDGIEDILSVEVHIGVPKDKSIRFENGQVNTKVTMNDIESDISIFGEKGEYVISDSVGEISIKEYSSGQLKVESHVGNVYYTAEHGEFEGNNIDGDVFLKANEGEWKVSDILGSFTYSVGEDTNITD